MSFRVSSKVPRVFAPDRDPLGAAVHLSGGPWAGQEAQNLRTLTGGVLSFAAVAKALRDSDTSREKMTQGQVGPRKVLAELDSCRET